MEPWDTLTLRGGDIRKKQRREVTFREVRGGRGIRVLSGKPGEENNQTTGNDSLVAKAVG